MCGIFGISKAPGNSEPVRSYLGVLFALGVMSEERGRDSAGIAAFGSDFDSACVAKNTVPFRELKLDNVAADLKKSSVVIGHTRYATQGSAGDVKNASPLLLKDICGTHNGDIIKSSVPNHTEHAKAAISGTDTEVLYRELEKYTPGSEKFLKALEKATGRIALAFVSRKIPNALVLVRGSISPLAYAYTQNGSLVYGSNPNWFRKIERDTNGEIKFSNITLVPEGSVLIFSSITNKLVATYSFVPRCRETDLFYVNSSAYKNFIETDKMAFRNLSYHILVKPELAKQPKPRVVSGYTPIAPTRVGFEDGALFDDLFLEGLTTVPFSNEIDEEEGRITLDHIETICELSGTFDEEMYQYLIESMDEEEVEARYAEVFVEAFRIGRLNDKTIAELKLPYPLGATVSTNA